MGYTNYYHVKKGLKKLPKEFLDDCEKVVKVWNDNHDKKLDLTASEDIVILNGDACTCEWFVINTKTDDRFIQRDDEGNLFNFTKTRADPYDSAVKALCMLGLAYGVITRWSFDGENSDPEYADAVNLLASAGLYYSGSTIEH